MAGGELASNSKAQQSSETSTVESGGARGKNPHLTWGELSCEMGREVSRGRISEEGP